MTRTEQLIVKFAFPRDDCMEMKPRALNGQDIPDWEKGPTMLEFLDRLREEGWCLAHGKTTGLMTFERQTSDDKQKRRGPADAQRRSSAL